MCLVTPQYLLREAAGLVKDAVRMIRTLIAASPVAGFDETTLQSGPAGDGEKKDVHGAFTELYLAFWLGTPGPGDDEGGRHPAVLLRDDDDQVPQRALEFLASLRGTRILRGIAAGTQEGNIARNQFHPLALDQAGQEPGKPETSA